MKDHYQHRGGFTVFFTGLPSAGKSTLTRLLSRHLELVTSRAITILDGDVVRNYLSSDLGFSKEDRIRNISRIAFVASEVTKAGGIVLVAAIAPFEESRAHARELISAHGKFILVHVSAPVHVCEGRDVKGLYRLAREGKLQNLTGVDDPYEIPATPELRLDTSKYSEEECVTQVLKYLRECELLHSPDCQ